VGLLKRQVEEFNPRIVAVFDRDAAQDMKNWGRSRRLQVWEGVDGLARLAAAPESNFVLSAVVGAVGLLPLLRAVQAGKTVALANKEALIVAGDLVMAEARKHGATILPVDSEHSAIFQCLGSRAQSIRRIILTASGGAFYRYSGNLNKVTPTQALKHPTWKMGKKITIDCATLTNKGLEAIEAHHLFGVPLENIHIVIHPQSIVHSLVEFIDGAMLAQLSHPDMRLPIQYALTYPERRSTTVRPLELEEIQRLEFFKPDFRRFPCLEMVLKAGRRGGLFPAVLNGANEVAVEGFIQGRIPFTGISRVLGKVMGMYGKVKTTPQLSLETILAADAWAREKAKDFMGGIP
jgi:1-deoxy-D-xylulose-5-phosphate reductoisomerase